MTGDPDDLLTIDEVITILRVSRAAFYRWRRRGTGPPSVRLPGGAVRFPRSALPRVAARPARPRQEENRSMTSYDVKFWDPNKIGDTAKGRWRVRWAVAGREHCKSFAARPLADGFAHRAERRHPRPPALRREHRPARPARPPRHAMHLV